jgi:signal peptidase II
MAIARKTLRYALFTALMVMSVSCDQGTKSWARASLPPDIHVIDGFWDFHLAENPGGAFSLLRDLPGGRYLLTGVGLALLFMIFVWVKRNADKGWLPCAALGLIAGGAIGNLWDRVVHGRVTDFVWWHWRSHGWPVFNVADAMLLIGVALMLLSRDSLGGRQRSPSSPR